MEIGLVCKQIRHSLLCACGSQDNRDIMAEDHDALIARARIEYEGVDDQFPIGLRVLAVDDNIESLEVLASLLRSCCYNVTPTTNATMAIKVLRNDPRSFDIVIGDIHMADMNGFEFLDTIYREMGIPVVMVSKSDDVGTVMKAINLGACSFLSKPLRTEELQNIWQHVYRKRMMNKHQPAPNKRTRLVQNDYVGSSRNSGSHNDGLVANSITFEAKEELAQVKKARTSWKPELHVKFTSAVEELGGLDVALPREILRLMNVPDLTRPSVASHLQKCREQKKKQEKALSHPNVVMLNSDITGNTSSRLPTTLNSFSYLPSLRTSEPNLHAFTNPVLHEEQQIVIQNPMQKVPMGFPPASPSIGADATTLVTEGSTISSLLSDATFQDFESEQFIHLVCSSMLHEAAPNIDMALETQ